METGLFEIQAKHLNEFKQARHDQPEPGNILYGMFRLTGPTSADGNQASELATMPKSSREHSDPIVELSRCFLRLANLTSYPLDRLSRYEATLWRQAAQILFALRALDRRKPQDRDRRFR